MAEGRKKICFVVTVESAVVCFLLSQLRELVRFYDVTLLLNTTHPDFLALRGIDIRVIPVRIERNINIWRDLAALWFMIRLFRKDKFDMVQSLMPKAGLLAMLAGLLARVPVRSHIFTGQVWATRKGFMRVFLKMMDRLMVVSATSLLSDSPSQRDFLVAQRVVGPKRIRVLHKGSMCGVDLSRFHPNTEIRQGIREHHGFKEEDVVFLFVGRLNRDKGVLDLAMAFGQLCRELPNVRLLVVGPEEDEGIVQQIKEISTDHQAKISFTGFTDRPEDYMAASDIFCLPSYRESFGDVIMQAAAVGIPAIASRIYGITNDTIMEGINGLLHEPGDVGELTLCMSKLANDKELRNEMGKNAHGRAVREFSCEQVTQAWLRYYDSLL